MRCPTCGTENAPDSRFCGECGARVQKSSVAPTHKITDAAAAPQPAPVAPAPAVAPPAAYAPAPPPTAPRPAPVAAARPLAYVAPTAPSPEPSLAGARPRSRTGLIVTLLAIDLGLAAAGAWLLREGLASPEPPTTSQTDASPRKAP